MKRRDFLRLWAPLVGAFTAAPLRAQRPWRGFDLVHRIELPGARGSARIWLPVPLRRVEPFQRELSRATGGNASTVRTYTIAPGCEMLVVSWAIPIDTPVFEVTTFVETTGHRVLLDGSSPAPPRPADLDRYLLPTRLIPVDGIVRDTAVKITRGHTKDLARARAIYDWIVENTARDNEVKGCGLGDIRGMLETGNLRGKCADLNALFVGLCRAARLPARDLYGIRLAPSNENPSLGRAGGNITTAQHCRAEVYVERYGWIPVDPADVRKVILEERPPLDSARGALSEAEWAQAPLSDPAVARARERLFGSWEMNWIAYNDAHDVVLPGSKGKPVPFLMYPQAEVNGERRDSLDPEHFKYTITAKEVT